MIRLLILFTLSSLSIIGQSHTKNISCNYYGWWADTRWEYIFSKNNNFIFNTGGHFGNTHTMGIYHFSGDTIFLLPFAKEKQTDSGYLYLKDSLLIEGDSCVIQLSTGYDYCKGKQRELFIQHSRKSGNKKYACKPEDGKPLAPTGI